LEGREAAEVHLQAKPPARSREVLVKLPEDGGHRPRIERRRCRTVPRGPVQRRQELLLTDAVGEAHQGAPGAGGDVEPAQRRVHRSPKERPRTRTRRLTHGFTPGLDRRCHWPGRKRIIAVAPGFWPGAPRRKPPRRGRTDAD